MIFHSMYKGLLLLWDGGVDDVCTEQVVDADGGSLVVGDVDNSFVVVVVAVAGAGDVLVIVFFVK